ncbi:DUF2304 family protein [Achromobacter kerstersii]|jgi:hypothetical protein
MIAQIVLTLGFAGLAACGWLRMGRVRVFAGALTLICLAGIYFIWVPSNLTIVANFIGIGRGADLLLYIFLTFVMFELLMVRIRDKERDELITRLARSIAIEQAKHRAERKATEG